MSRGKHEDKALEDILKGREVRKKIWVPGGFDKDRQKEIEKQEEEDRKSAEAYSKIMAKVRMPLFCPSCQNVMNKRLDKKFWMMHNKCMSCQVKLEGKIREEGKWEEYENEKMKLNVESWLRDQETQFNEWKKIVLENPDESFISNEQGEVENWTSSVEGNKKLVKDMEKEFDKMKKDIRKALSDKIKKSKR